jgi:hypothetical protein
MHWDEAYVIGLDGDIWSARFHGSADELRAHTSTELRELIRADYAYRQRVRRVRAAGDGTEVAGDACDDNDSGRSGEDGGTGREGSGRGDRGSDVPDLADADLADADLPDDDVDDDDYAAHFDGAQGAGAQIDSAQIDSARTGAGLRHGREPDESAGLSRAAVPHGSFANLRGERMST